MDLRLGASLDLDRLGELRKLRAPSRRRFSLGPLDLSLSRINDTKALNLSLLSARNMLHHRGGRVSPAVVSKRVCD